MKRNTGEKLALFCCYSAVIFFGVLFLLMCLPTGVSLPYGVCSQTQYRQISVTPRAIVSYIQTSFTQYYKCGRRWRRRRRCSRMAYKQTERTRYEARYSQESYTRQYCCSGFIGQPPNCRPRTCPVLQNPGNGTVQYGRREFRSIASYGCNYGFEIIGSDIRMCQASGTWSGSAPHCQLLQCPVLDNPDNGTVTYTHKGTGDIASYTCDAGFRVDGDASRVCLHNETWTGEEPNCTRLYCPELANPQSGQVVFGERVVGDKAMYNCSSQYRIVGATTRVCEESENWSGSQPHCIRLHCPALRSPPNGNVVYGLGFVGEVARYRCHEGYALEGNSTRVCERSEQWSGSEPSCNIVTCPSLPSLVNGKEMLSSNSRHYGTTATYTCDLGYELIGSSSLTCQSDGQWSSPPPTCERLSCPALPPPSNGNVTYSHGHAGDIATFRCFYGYRLVGAATRVCQHTEEWSGDQPVCERIHCPPLSNLPDGSVSYGEGYVDDVATYTCSDGFRMEGGAIRVCLPSGAWNGTSPICYRLQCPDLIAPQNGHIEYGSGFEGDVARYSCNIGYNLVGEISRTCQTNEQWTGIQPNCSIVSCPSLTNPENGRVQDSSNVFMSVAAYTCDINYKLNGSSSLTCQSDSQWSSPPPTCERLSCPALPPPSNGNVTYSLGYAGDIATFRCFYGYTLVGVATRVCQHTEEWSGDQPVCERIHCPPLSNPANGSVSYGEGYVDDVATYTCSNGFRMEGGAIRVCLPSGAWNGTSPTCYRLQCPDLIAPQNGHIEYGSGFEGDVARYSCNIGYNLVGEISRTCQTNEQWSGAQPHCSIVSCPSLTDPENGRVQDSSNVFMSVAAYTCDLNYKLNGSSILTCQSDGQWNSPPPTCERLSCPALPPPSNGNVTYNHGYAGDVATFRCFYGYKLVGVSTRVCQHTEEWSGDQPVCERIHCPPLSNPANGSVFYDEGYVDDVATYTCRDGFGMEGDAIRVCLPSGVWNGTAPICYYLPSQLIQLRLEGMEACHNLLIRPEKRTLSEIIEATIQGANKRCPVQCGLSSRAFTESVLQCFSQNANKVTFRTRLHETTQASTEELVNAILQWVDSGAAMVVNQVLVKVDQTCLVGIKSFSDPECEQRKGMVEEQNQPTSSLGVYIGGGLGLLFLIIVLLLLLIICIRCLCCRKRKGQEEPYPVEVSNTRYDSLGPPSYFEVTNDEEKEKECEEKM